jgi:hypothetical protein
MRKEFLEEPNIFSEYFYPKCFPELLNCVCKDTAILLTSKENPQFTLILRLFKVSPRSAPFFTIWVGISTERSDFAD